MKETPWGKYGKQSAARSTNVGELSDQLAGAVARAVSPDGLISRWLSESEFLEELRGVIGNLFAEWRRKVTVVRDDLYDLGWSEQSRRANGFGMRRDPRRVAR